MMLRLGVAYACWSSSAVAETTVAPVNTATLPPAVNIPAVTLGGGVNSLGDGTGSTPLCADSYGAGWQAVMSADMRKWCGCSEDINVVCICTKLKETVVAAGTIFDASGSNGIQYGLRDGHVFAGKEGEKLVTTGDDESTMHGRAICKDYGDEFEDAEAASDPTGNGLEGGLWKLLLFLLAALLVLACCLKFCKCCDKEHHRNQQRMDSNGNGHYESATPRRGDTTDEETGEYSSGDNDYHTPRTGRGAPKKHSCPCFPCCPCCKPKKKPMRSPRDQQPLVDPNSVAVDQMVMTSQGAMVDETRYTSLGSLGTIVQESVHSADVGQQLPAAVNYMR